VLLVLSVIHRVVSVLCCWQCCCVAGTNVDVLLVLLLVCCVACVVIGVLHCWCWCIALLVLLITFLIMFLSTHLNHSTFGVGVDALLVLLIMFLNACLNNFSLCCSFTLLIYSLSYYSHCMCFGEILLSPIALHVVCWWSMTLLYVSCYEVLTIAISLFVVGVVVGLLHC
jgi:hypothetical protein